MIDCNIVNGTPPINITWFRNGSLYPTRGSVYSIIISDTINSDVFKCRADNIIGFDTESTTIYVEYGKCVCVYMILIILCVYVCIVCCMYVIVYACVFE